MFALRFIFLVAACWLAAVGPAEAEGPLDVAGRRAERVVLLREKSATQGLIAPVAECWMGRVAGSVLRTFTGDELNLLASCFRARQNAATNDQSSLIAHVRLDRGEEHANGRLLRRADSRLVLEREGDTKDHVYIIDTARLDSLYQSPFADFIGDFDTPPAHGQRQHSLPFSVACWSPIQVDREELKRRFFAGLSPPPPPPMSFRPGADFAWLRIPRDYDPRVPAGLIVWNSPGDRGDVPPQFFDLADELNFFLVSPRDAGNERPVSVRLQLALHCVSSVMSAHHVDPRRVYVSGLSGGGKMATILQAGCPEVFTGCMPIVGTGWRRDHPLPQGGAWPAIVGAAVKGSMDTLRRRRIAPITGPEDFNHGPVLAFAEQMEADGLTVRLFDVPGLAHEMPDAGTLREAVMWIDEPYQRARSREIARAAELIRAYTNEFGEHPPSEARANGLLRQVLEEAPWTPEAWRALNWLTTKYP